MYVSVAPVNVVMCVYFFNIYVWYSIYVAVPVCVSLIYIRDVVYVGISLIYVYVINVVSIYVFFVYKWCCDYMCFFHI